MQNNYQIIPDFMGAEEGTGGMQTTAIKFARTWVPLQSVAQNVYTLGLKVQFVNRNPNQIKPLIDGLIRTGLTVNGLWLVWIFCIKWTTNCGWTVF